MKRALAAIAVLFIAAVAAFSQDDRNPIITASLNSFEYSHKVADKSAGSVIGEIAAAVLGGQSSTEREGYEKAVRSAILKGMSDAHRLRVVDGLLTDEEASQPNSIYVDANLANITTTTKNEVVEYEEKGQKKTRTEVYYRALLSVTLHVKNAMNDAVLSSPVFNIAESDMSWVNSPEKAIANAMGRLSNRITHFFDGMYPLTCQIIERAGEKNDKQKSVYIDLGSAHGLTVGQTLAIYTIKLIGGKEARSQVARLRVKSVEGEEVSFCKVLSGGRDLKAALDEGLDLIVETI